MSLKNSKILVLIRGKGLRNKGIVKIKRFLKPTHVNVKVTRYKYHIEKILSNLTDYDGIITVGGDGTINEAVNHIDRDKQWIAFFPGGTFNCLPRYFKMKTNSEFFYSFLENNREEKFDLLETEFIGTDFILKKQIIGFITVGHLTNMTILTDKLRWYPRILRYPIAAIINFFSLKKFNADISSESENSFNNKFSSIVINNCATEMFSFINDWKYNDGEFEYKTKNNNLLTQYLSIINRCFRLSGTDKWKRQNTFLNIKFKKPVPVMADGEVYYDIKELRINLLKQVQKVRLPANIS